ncbi:MAG: carbohydrate kinase family protein [Eubacteriales bacterium]
MKKILCIGSVTADLMLSPVDSLPESGTLAAIEHMLVVPGGCASNTAVDIAKLGGNSALCCKIGRDSFGDMVISSFEHDGVDVSPVVRGDTPTTTSVVCISSSGERSFIYYPGSAAAQTSDDIPRGAVDAADIIFVGGAELLASFIGQPCADFFAQCQSDGKFTALDTAWDYRGRWMLDLQPVLKYTDLFMPSESEAEMLTGTKDLDKMADEFFRLGVKNVIIKAGKRGAYICEGGRERYMSPALPEKAKVDTTGAGDSFCAGFLYGIAAGFDYADSAVIANAVGAHSIAKMGATSGIPTIEEIYSYLDGLNIRIDRR